MKLSISQRLWLPTVLIGAVFGIVFVVTLWSTQKDIARQVESERQQQFKVETALRWAGLTETNAARVLAGLSGSDPAVEAAMAGAIKQTTARISELQKQVEALPADEAEKAAFAQVAATRKAYIDVRNEAMKLRAAGDVARAQQQVKDKVVPAIDAYAAAQRGYIELQQKRWDEMREAVAKDRVQRVYAIGGLLMGMVGVLAVFTFFAVRSVVRPLHAAVHHAERVGSGDLASRLLSDRSDEIGGLLRALDAMQQRLRTTVAQLRQTADGIATASQEIASGNQDLSTRTEQTASSLQQTASSIEQLTGTVTQTADAARTANQLAASASEVAGKGGAVVAQVVSTMEEIHAASRRIADIIATIDGIAFQTNILALNAAVEAARAGEQGRGFAVVAGEVRSLAQRSAEAAREIKALIGASVDKVENGSRLVADAGQTMQEIVASVQRVTDMIGEISAAAGEQSQGIGQVNAAVTQLDQMTQQNAALVEQSAAAAESLREQARQLAQAVAAFRTETAAA